MTIRILASHEINRSAVEASPETIYMPKGTHDRIHSAFFPQEVPKFWVGLIHHHGVWTQNQHVHD